LIVEIGGVVDVLSASTLNFGMINGGTRSNIVADRCTLRVDIRITPQLHAHGGALKLLKDFIHRYDTEAQVQMFSDAPPLNTDPTNPFVQKLVLAGAELTGAPWFCDAAYLAEEGGIPAIAIGPGGIAQAHTKDEWIKVADLEAGVDFFKAYLRSL